MVFCFRHLKWTKKFSVENQDDRYVTTLLERLRDMCRMYMQECLSSRSSSLRFHPIDWTGTSEPAGFDSLPEHLRDSTPYQFSVSRNNGRVHGFVIGHIFHVVWLDPDHALYP